MSLNKTLDAIKQKNDSFDENFWLKPKTKKITEHKNFC